MNMRNTNLMLAGNHGSRITILLQFGIATVEHINALSRNDILPFTV
ncbi:MAG: hypothetical protein PHV06_05145 [bacterium]|nr:hypothetical protein [bacterium]